MLLSFVFVKCIIETFLKNRLLNILFHNDSVTNWKICSTGTLIYKKIVKMCESTENGLKYS